MITYGGIEGKYWWLLDLNKFYFSNHIYVYLTLWSLFMVTLYVIFYISSFFMIHYNSRIYFKYPLIVYLYSLIMMIMYYYYNHSLIMSLGIHKRLSLVIYTHIFFGCFFSDVGIFIAYFLGILASLFGMMSVVMLSGTFFNVTQHYASISISYWN